MAGLAFGKMPIVNKQTECSWRFTKQEVSGTTFSILKRTLGRMLIENRQNHLCDLFLNLTI